MTSSNATRSYRTIILPSPSTLLPRLYDGRQRYHTRPLPRPPQILDHTSTDYPWDTNSFPVFRLPEHRHEGPRRTTRREWLTLTYPSLWRTTLGSRLGSLLEVLSSGTPRGARWVVLFGSPSLWEGLNNLTKRTSFLLGLSRKTEDSMTSIVVESVVKSYFPSITQSVNL